jgi:hypothetical protein
MVCFGGFCASKGSPSTIYDSRRFGLSGPGSSIKCVMVSWGASILSQSINSERYLDQFTRFSHHKGQAKWVLLRLDGLLGLQCLFQHT